jgi:DNA polymerase
MSVREELVHLIRQTARAVQQQTELGVDTCCLQRRLEEVLAFPQARPSPAASVRPQETLEAVYQQYCACTKCRLGHRRQRFVFGSGNERADVMFIGEAPGAEEDEQGVPFVGPAGQLLTRILKAIDFTRDEVYIANIVKCRPPNNRDPQPDEIAACAPILSAQIRLVGPKLICALGRIAAQALLGTPASLNRLRGRFHEYQGIKVLVTYHPSALLRNPAFKRPTWEDVQMLRREYDRMVRAEVQASEE